MGPRYEALLSLYIAELREAKEAANDWWSTLVAITIAKEGSTASAELALRRRWPIGAAAHPRFIHVVRKYYLACEALNEQVLAESRASEGDRMRFTVAPADPSTTEAFADQPISPGVLVSELLETAATRDLAKIVGRFSYWPIGVDEGGRYV